MLLAWTEGTMLVTPVLGFAVSIVVYFFCPSILMMGGGESEGGGFLEFGVNSVFQCIPDF